MDSFRKTWPFIIGLILSSSLLWPLFTAPLFTRHDDVEIIRLFEMDKCFKDGQIPCRWVPDLGGLYGYPIFNYYAPLPYYFGELIYIYTHSLIVSVKVMYITAFLGAYVFMYLFARKFWGILGGSLSAVFYSFAPYHALDFYVRGAMGEMWALMVFPALFWTFSRLENKKNYANIFLCAIAVAILITSHNLSTMIFLPILCAFIVLLFFKKREIIYLGLSLLAIILGIFLSSFYLFPVIFEKNLVHVDTTTVGYFSYTEHFKGFKKLLDRSWGYGASIREVPGGEKDGLSYQIGWVHILGGLLAILAAYKLQRKKPFFTNVIFFSVIVLGLAIFMINPRSQFIWQAIEPLKYLQFPWRFLMIVIFFISFICGSFLISNNHQKKWWFLLVITVVVLNFSYFKPEKFLQISDEQLLKGVNWEKQIKRSIFDYLPIYAKEPPAELASERYKILTGESRIFDFSQGSNWIKFKTETKTHTIIRISQYYFPDWRVFVDGEEKSLEYRNNNLGLMTIILGKGNHNIYLKLFDTKIRSFSDYLTIGTAAILLFLFTVQLKRVRRWIEYYKKRVY